MKCRKVLGMVIIAGMLFLTGCTGNGKAINIEAGMTAIEQLKYEDAMKCFELAQKEKEDKRLIARGKGLAYMGMTQYEEANKCFLEALSFSSGIVDQVDYDMNYYMAVSYYKLGNLKKAAEVYSAIIELQPKQKEAYLLRGIVELENKQLKEAIADFEQAIAMDKNDYELLIEVYTSMQKYGYQEEGSIYLQNALKDEQKTMSDAQAGMISYYLGDYESARNFLEKSRSAGGEKVILFLGKTYEELGDRNYSATLYSEYLEKHPESIAVSNQLALSKMEAKDYEGALTAIEAAMLIENNDMMQVLKLNEIIANEYLGDFKKATVLMESYLETYPDDAQAVREYDFLKTR